MFELWWPVDEVGYVWVEPEHVEPKSILLGDDPRIAAAATYAIAAERAADNKSPALQRSGGPESPHRHYEVFSTAPDLFRRFAALPLPADKDAILDFSGQFGELGGLERASIARYERGISQMRTMISTLNTFKDDLRGAAMAFNAFFAPKLEAHFHVDEASYHLQFRPMSLYSAMIMQVSLELSGISSYRYCKNCSAQISIGKKQATIRKDFCSDRCRVAWNRKQKSEAGK